MKRDRFRLNELTVRVRKLKNSKLLLVFISDLCLVAKILTLRMMLVNRSYRSQHLDGSLALHLLNLDLHSVEHDILRLENLYQIDHRFPIIELDKLGMYNPHQPQGHQVCIAFLDHDITAKKI